MESPNRTQKALAPKDYVYIRSWGKSIGSMDYYIEQDQKRAFADNAPIDALFERSGIGGVHTGEWACASHLHADHPFLTYHNTLMQESA